LKASAKTKEQGVLEHIGLYSLTLRQVLDHAFFDGRDNACNNVIKSLKQKGLIVDRHELHGRVTYYQLSEEGALRAALTTAAAAPILSRLHQHLAILWFCFMDTVPRALVTKPDLKQFFPESASSLNAPHCLEQNGDGEFCLYRVRVVKKVQPANLLKDLRAYIRKALSTPDTRAALLDGHYGFAILSENRERLSEFEQLVHENNLHLADISPSQQYVIPFCFGYAPSTETIGIALNEFRKRKTNA